MASAANELEVCTHNLTGVVRITVLAQRPECLIQIRAQVTFNLPAGYYKLNVNAAVDPMTYTAVATVWGVIGDASPGGWGDETALTYNPTLRIWMGAMNLTAANIKFRANHDWGYNYGAPVGSQNLVAGGPDIAISAADVYAITLDLSHPNEYTYRADRWGIIGSATAGGWSS